MRPSLNILERVSLSGVVTWLNRTWNFRAWDNPDLRLLEGRFWMGDPAACQEALDPKCVMAFPAPAGIMAPDAIVRSIADAPRWSSIECNECVIADPAPGLAVIAYRARTRREGASVYEAYCTSSYRAAEAGWKLFQHQQTPILEASPR